MTNDHARSALTVLLALLSGAGLTACGGDTGRSGGAAGDSASAASDTPAGELAYVSTEG